MIYLDNAATTMQKPAEVTEAVISALSSLGNAGRGVHESALSASRVIYEARVRTASFFGAAHAKQVAFTSNITEALNIAIKGILQPGDHAITTVLDHNSVLRPLYEMQEKGVSLTILQSDESGNISYDAMEEAIRPETRAIVCTGASNLSGNLLDFHRIGEIARAHHILFIMDAAQVAGCHPVDVGNDHIDVLCFTGHKGLYGPQGTGGLIVREGITVRPLKSGGSGVQTYSKTHPEEMPTALEAGTLNGHGIAGLLAAIDFITETGIDSIRAREIMLAKRFYDGVKEIPEIRFYGNYSDWDNRTAIVALNLGDEDSAFVSDALAVDYGIATRPGAHCAPLMHESFGTVNQGIVRFSFSYFNTEEEVDTAIRAMRELAAGT